MTAELEVVVDPGVGGKKLLRMANRFEPSHVAFPSSRGLVRHLTAVVEIPALPMLDALQDLAFRGPVGSKFIRHDHPRYITQALQQLAKEALGRILVAAALDQHIEHVPVLIDGPPEIVEFAADANEQLIQKP